MLQNLQHISPTLPVIKEEREGFRKRLVSRIESKQNVELQQRRIFVRLARGGGGGGGGHERNLPKKDGNCARATGAAKICKGSVAVSSNPQQGRERTLKKVRFS